MYSDGIKKILCGGGVGGYVVHIPILDPEFCNDCDLSMRAIFNDLLGKQHFFLK